MKRAACVLAALLLAVALVGADAAPAVAVTWSEVNALKDEAGSLSAKRKDLKKQLKALERDRSKVLERKKLLDEQVANTVAQIENVKAQIEEYNALIIQTEAELLDAQEREAAQYELFSQRVRNMEERGTVSYWSVLFKATSFTDMLGRLDIINEIMDADQRVIDELKALQAEIEAKKADLEESRRQSEAAKADLEVKKQELDDQRREANALIKQLAEDAEKAERALDELEAEEDSIQREILRLSQKLAEEEAAKGGGGGGGNARPAARGGYIWPVSSHYITSPYGPRPSPGGIGSRYHKGIDIGRVGYSTEVHAAKAGTVIVSQYSRSYGNYVVVSHGSGNTTLYAHMSRLIASVGQYVNQGDVLGITGSTGNSIGPHLHFEITENGQRIDPMKYLG